MTAYGGTAVVGTTLPAPQVGGKRTFSGYDASKVAVGDDRFTSTPAFGRNAQMAVIHRVIEIWARSMLNRIRPNMGHVLD